MRKLNIGGESKADGWEILNIQPGYDHQGDAADLSRFDDKTFGEIYASHVLEHLEYEAVNKALKEWHRVLMKDGNLYVSVPDLDVLCWLFIDKTLPVKERIKVLQMMFGGHKDEYDYHYIGFDFEILARLLTTAGFKDIKKVKDFGLFRDCSTIEYLGKPISLNIKARK